jgi:hypothetical protein
MKQLSSKLKHPKYKEQAVKEGKKLLRRIFPILDETNLTMHICLWSPGTGF